MDFFETLAKLWPHAKPGVIAGITSVAEDCFSEYAMSDPLVICHFMGQVSQECGQGRITRESMNYSADRLLEIFGVGHHSAKVTPEEAQRLAHNERAIAERVYGMGNPKKAKELGNEKPGDAFKFRGNGFLQLTGGDSHKRIGEMTGFDLYNHPEMLEDPEVSFRVACAEFQALGAIEFAMKDDVPGVTKKVNGGRNGLAERIVFVKQWKELMNGIQGPAWKPRAAPDPDQPTMSSSKIAQAGIGTGVAVAVNTASQISQSITQTTDKIQITQDNVKHVLVQVKPFLGLDPEAWHIIALTASFIALLGIAKVLWERYKKLRDQGV